MEPRKRFVYVIDCREAPDALHLAPLTVDPPAYGSGPRVAYSCAANRPRKTRSRRSETSTASITTFFEQQVWPQLAARVPAFESIKVDNAWAGYYDYNTLDQNAVIGRILRSRLLFRQRLFRARRAAGGRCGRAIAELIGHGAFQTLDLTRLGYARIRQSCRWPSQRDLARV